MVVAQRYSVCLRSMLVRQKQQCPGKVLGKLASR
jgi:hypothetical protein